jgi:hypothetical protein
MIAIGLRGKTMPQSSAQCDDAAQLVKRRRATFSKVELMEATRDLVSMSSETSQHIRARVSKRSHFNVKEIR